MIMKDPKDPFYLTRTKVFVWGACATAVLCLLVYLFVPSDPKNGALSAPLQGPGSESAALEGKGAAAGAVPASPVEVATAAPASAKPEQNYVRFCAGCHGAKGDADTQMARMMNVKPSNLINGPFKFERTPQAVKALILNGNGIMPGFAQELGQEQAAALAEFVLAMHPKDSQ